MKLNELMSLFYLRVCMVGFRVVCQWICCCVNGFEFIMTGVVVCLASFDCWHNIRKFVDLKQVILTESWQPHESPDFMYEEHFNCWTRDFCFVFFFNENQSLGTLDHLKIGLTRGISIEFSERMWIWLWLFNFPKDEHEKTATKKTKICSFC